MRRWWRAPTVRDGVQLLTTMRRVKHTARCGVQLPTVCDAVQASNETISEFITALKKISEKCEFPDLEDRLRDALVCGILNGEIQSMLLMNSMLTFKVAQEMALAHEAAVKNVAEIKDGKPQEEMNVMGRAVKVRRRNEKIFKCFRCGYTNHREEQCFFKDKRCFKCQKLGHISRVCKNGNWRSDRNNCSIDEEAEATNGLFNINQVKDTSNMRNYMVKVRTSGRDMNMLIDSGTEKNIISEKTYIETWVKSERPRIEKDSTKLVQWNRQRLSILGKIKADVKVNKRSTTMELLVIEGPGPNLIGRETFDQIGIGLEWINYGDSVCQINEVIMENGVTAKRHQDQLMRRVKGEVSEDVEKKEECNTKRRGEQMNDPNESPERLEETPGPSRPIRNRRLPEYLKDCLRQIRVDRIKNLKRMSKAKRQAGQKEAELAQENKSVIDALTAMMKSLGRDAPAAAARFDGSSSAESFLRELERSPEFQNSSCDERSRMVVAALEGEPRRTLQSMDYLYEPYWRIKQVLEDLYPHPRLRHTKSSINYAAGLKAYKNTIYRRNALLHSKSPADCNTQQPVGMAHSGQENLWYRRRPESSRHFLSHRKPISPPIRSDQKDLPPPRLRHASTAKGHTGTISAHNGPPCLDSVPIILDYRHRRGIFETQETALPSNQKYNPHAVNGDYFTPSLKNFTIQPDPNNHTMPHTTQSFLHNNLNSTTNVENYIAAHPHLINDCKKLIRENIGLFPIDKFSVPALNIDPVKIIPNSDKIITLRPYRIPYSDYPEIKYQIEKMLENEIIEPSNSPYAAPVTLARKRDGSKRFCVDFRKLNELMSVDNYPIPLIETVLDQLSNSKYFSTIDITSAFWQIPIHPESRPLLSFVTHLGQYHFNRLPFGLKLSPQIFERQLNQLIQKHKLTFANHYFDDFIIHSNSLEEHLGHLQEFFHFCKLENIKLNLNKCQFFRTSIDYLGYKISSGTCTPLVRNIDVINAIKPPTNVKTLQSFLGAINVYNKFIPDYARIRNSLNQLLKKNVKWEWTSDCQKAFDKHKQLLSSGPILHLYKSDLPCQVYSDASLQGIGGILKQLHLSLSPDGNSYPVQYYSRTLRKYERNYTITELECLAIIETVDRFKVYLAGNGFTIFTDHCALQWLKNIKNPTGRLFRWSLRLSVYDYQVKYIKGTKQLEADLLSRNPFCGLLDATQLKMYQSELRDNSKYVHQTSGLTTVTRRGVSKIVVPPSLRPTILREAHQKFNHPGISQLTRIISAQYFWSGMSIDIRAFVKNCNICQMSKTPKGPKYGELGELTESPLPFDLVSMDTIAGFARYGSAKNYLHVVVDHATRFAWTFPSRSTSTTTYIQVIKKVLQSGCPKRLLTDRAPAFTSPRFRRFLISHNIQPMLTTSNHPQANGLSERLNATLTGKLRLLHLQHPRASWTMLQSKVVKAYNDTPHSVTGFPPSYLMDGSLPKELSQHLDPYPSVTESRRLALQRTKERHKIDKIRFDKNHRSPDFEVGDLVLTKIYQHPNTGKLVPNFSGPYEIIEVISPYTVRINRPNQAQNLETEIIHVNKLKHYSEDTKYIFTPQSTNNNSKPKSYFIYNHFPPEIFHDDYKNYASTLSNPFNHMNPDIFLDNVEPTLTARYISTPDTIPKIAIQLKPSPTTKIILPSSPTRNHTPQISPQLRAPLINCDNTKLENRSVIIKSTLVLLPIVKYFNRIKQFPIFFLSLLTMAFINPNVSMTIIHLLIYLLPSSRLRQIQSILIHCLEELSIVLWNTLKDFINHSEKNGDHDSKIDDPP
ncbi:hypothetical protein LAZ67_3001847 [Cordylochernes scorpioides]|uniref:RNA-directed DNA polymerase n=1 Tax=Cordylochernes scorpioides TaxID=51811 RepID=A0ABY6K839_9ARAC|nr:hypothetical protein LAZ67_3001847 [Cordylochernes scorpioides]